MHKTPSQATFCSCSSTKQIFTAKIYFLTFSAIFYVLIEKNREISIFFREFSVFLDSRKFPISRSRPHPSFFPFRTMCTFSLRGFWPFEILTVFPSYYFFKCGSSSYYGVERRAQNFSDDGPGVLS